MNHNEIGNIRSRCQRTPATHAHLPHRAIELPLALLPCLRGSGNISVSVSKLMKDLEDGITVK